MLDYTDVNFPFIFFIYILSYFLLFLLLLSCFLPNVTSFLHKECKKNYHLSLLQHLQPLSNLTWSYTLPHWHFPRLRIPDKYHFWCMYTVFYLGFLLEKIKITPKKETAVNFLIRYKMFFLSEHWSRRKNQL